MADEDRVGEIIADWLDRRGLGEDVSPESVIREHPDLAAELRAHFQFLTMLEVVGPASIPRGEPGRIGEYRLVREIGRGGMGVVYEAEQTSMGRRVALKVLSPAVTSVHQAIQRFHREARAAGQIHHTNIVPVYAMGVDRGLHYYAMELVEGETLAEVIAAMRDRKEGGESSPGESRLGLSTQDSAGWAQLAEAVAGVAEALEAAHDEGILHRDVKPTNLLVTDDGTLKLVDFGLARLTGEGGSMTVTGQLLGTPHYMSPEQARAREIPIDHRTDVYSLGATLYEVLTLRTPFQGDTLHEICSQIISKDPPSIRKANPRVPRDLETIVVKAMEKDRDRRYSTAGEMARDLRRFAEGVPIRARRIGIAGRAWRKVKRNKVRAALVAAVVVLAAAGGVLALRASHEVTRRTELEYLTLCAEAAEALPRSMVLMTHCECAERMLPGETSRDVYARAIPLRPDRPEAYFGRALVPGRTLEQKLGDLDAARARGLPEGTWHLGRALLLRARGRAEEAEEEERLAGRGEPGTPAEAYFRARLESKAGRQAEALRLLSEAIDSAEPGVRYLALRHRATVLGERREFSEALEDLHAVRTLGDDSVTLRLRIAVTWRRMGNRSAAETGFREALEETTRRASAPIWRRLCLACREAEEWAWLETASSEALRAVAETPALLLERAVAREVAGRRDEAFALCRRALDLDPRDVPTLTLLGDILLAGGHAKPALEKFEQALEGRPGSAEHLARKGRALIALGELSSALVELERAVDLDPELPMAHEHLGCALEKLERPDEALDAYARAIRLDPTSSRTYGRRWRLLRRLGRAEEARREMDEAAESRHPGPAGHHLRTHVLMKLGRWPDALAASEEALRTRARTDCLLIDQAVALGRVNRADEALEILDEIRSRRPDHHRTLEERGSLLMTKGRLEEAVGALDRAIELRDSCVNAHDLRAKAHVRLENWKAARRGFERVIELEPNNADARSLLGTVLCDGFDQPENALEQFRKALERDRDHLDAHMLSGHVLEKKLGKPRDALFHFRRACELAPRRVRPWKQLANCLFRLREWKEAGKAYRKVTELESGNVRAWTWLGTCLGHLGLEEEALEAFEEALRLDPKNLDALLERGVSLEALHRREEALESFAEAVRHHPRSARAHLRHAGLLHRMGKYEEAIRAHGRAIEIDPEDHRAYHDRALAHLELDHLEEALSDLEKTIELRPRMALARFNRGIVLWRQEKLEEAVQAFDQGLALDSGYVKGRWWRAQALLEMEKPQEALDELDRVLAAWPDDANVHFERARAYQALRRHADALKLFDALLEREPTDHRTRWYRALSLRELQHFEEAREDQDQLRLGWHRDPDVPAEQAFLLACLGRFDEALEAAALALRMGPEAAFVLENRVWTLAMVGRWKEALSAAEKLAAKSPGHVYERVYCLRALGRDNEARKLAAGAAKGEPPRGHTVAFAYLCAVAGEREKALAILEDDERPWPPFCSWERARIHAVLGDADAALTWLARAADAWLRWPAKMTPDPEFRRLAADPRYQALRERLVRKD